MNRWAVVYTHGRQLEIWLTIANVPAEIGRAAVVEALEAWPRWKVLQSRIGMGGQLTVRRVGSGRGELPPARLGAGEVPAGLEGVLWEKLAPQVRRLTAPIDSRLYAAVARAAAARGLSINQYAAEVLATAVAPPAGGAE